MKTQDLRSAFVDYFKSHNHTPVDSGSLVPNNDPTLLFTNAGMNQFKNTFLGLEKRDYNRAVSIQKCVRAGGKHNDLENVGHTARHHTFFEMLGNFSFGDYFKKEAIHYGWDFLTNTLNLPKDKLYVTVFDTDDEAFDIWHKQENIPKDRIYRFGEKDNFWRMGKTGPCGPCSEIFYDLGEEVGGNPKDNVMGGEGDRYMEVWNLVFMQYFEDETGQMTPLPKPSIDTGAGVERLASILQGQVNNYHTDIFQSIIQKACSISNTEYVMSFNNISNKERASVDQTNIALRVLADHARTTAFLIADGVLPSNEGRGYVLRRIMRRAIRYGRSICEHTLFSELMQTVIDQMKSPYNELKERSQLILQTARDEEVRFLKTLDQGTELLTQKIKSQSQSSNVMDPEFVFKMYDTYGFPFDLTSLMLKENHFSFDENAVNKLMADSKAKARMSWKGNAMKSNDGHLVQCAQKVMDTCGSKTDFLGYDSLNTKSNVILMSDGEKELQELKAGQKALVVFASTPFYAESGGQVGDHGQILADNFKGEVFDCIKKNDVHFHWVEGIDGKLKLKESAELKLSVKVRRKIAAHHSATHLLHSALKEVLGDHVSQAGSLVEAHRLRFDFTHNKPVTNNEIQQIEDLVNREISNSCPVITEVMSPDDAKEKGAMALFGEKYGDKVRVLSMGDFSMELCGGTHVANTAEIRAVKIVSETGVSSGIRRIEALAGEVVLQYLLNIQKTYEKAGQIISQPSSWSEDLNATTQAPLLDWIEKTQATNKSLQKNLESAKGNQINIDDLVNSATTFKRGNLNARLVFADVSMDDRKVLSQVTDKLKNKIQTGVVVVIGKGDKSHPIIVSVSKDLIKDLSAGQLLKGLAESMGGKGGGRPDFAQGAAPNRDDLQGALKIVQELVLN
ncbi:MAG: alanine--tRNA ligase [Bdellovibrionaceae bacterium]|jgi:alanyl-tRNA synthetase|nr:alanine--tRNA ligase [Pseudobdellovibrionaceae bacterium]